MIVATTPFVAGHHVVETRGHVYGLVVRSRGLGGNIAAAVRSLAGGEIKEYTQLLEDTRRQAVDRLVANATLMRRYGDLDALRQLRDGKHHDRDRGLRHRGHPAGRRRGTPAHERVGRPVVNTFRVLAGAFGVLLMVGGVIGVASGAWAEGSWAVVAGAVVLLAVVFERSRYRSEAAERKPGDLGPGGGEPTMLAPFRPTGELFLDPTSGHKLRVYINPATGERRYFAEGEPPRP